MAKQAQAKRPASKGKDKKAQRKAELEKLKQTEVVVVAANEVQDLLEPFAAFRRYARRGVDADVTCARPAELSSDITEWAFQLCKTNMQAFYEGAAGMGWSDTKKRRQLIAPEARLLIVTGSVEGGERQPLAYCHFRFEVEGEAAVLYCWEVQVDQTVAKRRGLGRFFMTMLELLARKHGMEAVMLTVMNANSDAAALYHRLGYVMDESSPSACDAADDCGYEILTKKLAPRPTPEKKAGASDSACTAARQPMAALNLN